MHKRPSKLNLPASDSFNNSNSFYGNQDQTQFNLYCINIRAVNKECYPALAIRKLANTDNLLYIDEQNKVIQENIWLAHADYSFKFQKPIDVTKIP
jgi:hypothetical protein